MFTKRNDEVGEKIHGKKNISLEQLQRMASQRTPKQLLYYEPTRRRDP
jgi:hypothetical protein